MRGDEQERTRAVASGGSSAVSSVERGEHALWVQGFLGDARSWFERAFREAEATDEVDAMARPGPRWD